METGRNGSVGGLDFTRQAYLKTPSERGMNRLRKGVCRVLPGLLLLTGNEDLEEVGGAFHWSRASQHNHALPSFYEASLKKHFFSVFDQFVCTLDRGDKKRGNAPGHCESITDGLRGCQRKDRA